MKIIIREALGYAGASAGALIVDLAVLFILVQYFSWQYVLAATASFVVGLLFVYLSSITLVFKHRRLTDPRIEFASFAGIGAIGVAINAAVISLGVKMLGLHYLVAKCGAACFTFAWNFVARRQLLFSQRHTA